MDRLRIQNFAGIKDMEFEFKSITVLIGPQATGKSVAIKLLYFIKSYINDIVDSIVSNESKEEFEARQKNRFLSYFPKETWPSKGFQISYTSNGCEFKISRLRNGVTISPSISLETLFEELRRIYAQEQSEAVGAGFNPLAPSYVYRQMMTLKLNEYYKGVIETSFIGKQFFIPAGRSFYANLQKSIFSLLKDNRTIDPFMIEFGSLYENLKGYFDDFQSIKSDNYLVNSFNDILNSTYGRQRDDDYLVHTDERSVNITNASSGQQETLPLMIILSVLIKLKFPDGATIYIEEPEAHLFPIAQKRIVHLLAKVFNSKDSKFQIIVTTHSPYVLASFNNLIQAGNLTIIKPKKAKAIASIIVKEEQIPPNAFAAYSLNNGELESLVDPETQLISQTVLDSVSNEIAKEFDSLLDLEF